VNDVMRLPRQASRRCVSLMCLTLGAVLTPLLVLHGSRLIAGQSSCLSDFSFDDCRCILYQHGHRDYTDAFRGSRGGPPCLSTGRSRTAGGEPLNIVLNPTTSDYVVFSVQERPSAVIVN